MLQSNQCVLCMLTPSIPHRSHIQRVCELPLLFMMQSSTITVKSASSCETRVCMSRSQLSAHGLLQAPVEGKRNVRLRSVTRRSTPKRSDQNHHPLCQRDMISIVAKLFPAYRPSRNLPPLSTAVNLEHPAADSSSALLATCNPHTHTLWLNQLLSGLEAVFLQFG